MGGKLVHNSKAVIMQQPVQTEAMQIKKNTNVNGEVLCIKCELAPLVKENRRLKVGVGFKKPKMVNVDTYFCDICDYKYLQKQEVKKIRKLLSK